MQEVINLTLDLLKVNEVRAMISMMLFYSCTCTTNRTGETKVQWNPHNTHIHTQMGHCLIVCIKQALRKNAADTVLLIMLKTEQKSLGHRNVFVVCIN